MSPRKGVTLPLNLNGDKRGGRGISLTTMETGMYLNSTDHTSAELSYAPFMVVNPGETLPMAIERHRRDTGHKGQLIVVAFNGQPRDRRSVHQFQAVA